MKEIILTDDDLRQLERRFGPCVRHMGPWNSDGIFGYCTVPMDSVEKVADALNDEGLSQCVQQLKDAPDRATWFMEVLQRFGSALIERIAAAHQQRFQMGHVVSRARSVTKTT